jgi:membrane protease YdiL (CAAX protease family)
MPGKEAIMVTAGAVVLALAAWVYLFRGPHQGIWTRTWVVAAAMSAYAIGAAAASGHLRGFIGPIDLGAVLAGIGVGVAWLVATHVGHDVLARLIPGFAARVRDLYTLGDGDRFATMIGPVTAMGVAEELLFRGTIQARAGLVVAVAVYAGVQLVTGNWVLAVAGASCGLVWGVLYWWTGGLVAPVIAHVIWTDVLTFLWPMPVTDDRPGDRSPVALGPDPRRAG